MPLKDIRRVPAKEFITRFEEFCEAAQREPVGVNKSRSYECGSDLFSRLRTIRTA